MVTILYFGKLADVTGCFQEQMVIPENIENAQDLKSWLDHTKAADGALLDPSVRIALDGEIATPDTPLDTSLEIAVMPTVGGG